ncbi:SusC/RagA family TonB-linked outer membrane protein [Membranihabitans marinus]|uniref:SusC/RagA family TonB-linked outer membrane protein n=1 Tax=Membranihabitans marinus TaxID=1227546 RepID=UPI001F2B4F97|nr:TonB-dependent receptor [Membranihabitans marinus]
MKDQTITNYEKTSKWKRLFFSVAFLIGMVFNVGISYGQAQSVSGLVLSDSGEETLVGVNILVKGTDIGVATDFDGKFILNDVSENAVLMVTYIGYQTAEIPIEGRTNLTIRLIEDSQTLDELVVVGYGEKSKRDVTTAISQISSVDITKRFSMSPEMAMQGQMSGVQVIGNNGNPMARPTIRVRGTNTWGVADPVYVLDGVILEEYGAGVEGTSQNGDYFRGNLNVMSLINPSDIESITVLKDASAAAIYGVRAANGVVLISTKSGKSGKPKVALNTRMGWTSLPNHIDMLNSKEYVAFNNSIRATSESSELLPEDQRVFDPASPHYLGNAPTTDWQRAIENSNAMTKDFSASLSGGTDAMNYFTSISKSEQDGVYLGNYMDRITGTFKLNIDVNSWLRMGVNGLVGSTKSNQPISNTLSAATAVPFQPIYDPNGGVNNRGFAQVLEGYDENGNWTGLRLYGSNTATNQIARNELNHIENSGFRGTGKAYVEVEPISHFKLKGAFSLDNLNTDTDIINSFEADYYIPQGGDPAAHAEAGSLGIYNVTIGNNQTTQFDLTANYENYFGNHKVDILVGAMGNKHKYEYREMYSENISNTDPEKIIFGSGSTNSVFNRREVSSRFGTFLRAGYNYASKYYLDFSIRRDGSSSFAPNHRWGVFPAASVAWRLSTEPFVKSLTFVDDFKIRAGYGQLGNDEVTKNAYLSLVNQRPNHVWGTTGDGYGNIYKSAVVMGLSNPTLSWETTTTFNIGFDAVFFKSLSMSFEYYDKLTEGLLQDVTIPLSSGIINGPESNVGDVSNRGIELNLSYSNSIGEVWYSVGGNLTTQKNEVLKLYEGIPRSTSSGRVEEGQSIGYIRGPMYVGTFQTEQEAIDWISSVKDVSYNEALVSAGDFYFKDLYGSPANESEFYNSQPDGQVDQFDQTYLGKVIPGFYYGLNFNAGYKGFSFDMVFYGVGDVQKYNPVRALANPSAIGSNRSREALNFWTPSNTDTDLPRQIWGDPANNFRFSNLFVDDASYFRLTNIKLSYDFPEKFYKTVSNYFSHLSIYVGSSNTFTQTRYGGLDPEDNNNPAPRMIYTGLNIKF